LVVVNVALRIAQPEDAEVMLGIIGAAFRARQRIDPPPEALSETIDTLRRKLKPPRFGVIASVDGRDVGCLVVSFRPDGAAMLHRVSVVPGSRRLGVAAYMVRSTALLLADQGVSRLQLMARAELDVVQRWWTSHGFSIDHEVFNGVIMSVDLPRPIQVPTAHAMQLLGVRLAGVLQAGDLVLLNGELGAGKTTLTQGIGAGLDVDGQVISPTFVLSRIHKPIDEDKVPLVHVDAYRISSVAELDDLDLEASMPGAITVIEWGAGLAEELAPSRLEIEIRRSDSPEDDTRTVYLLGIGPRWAGIDIEQKMADVWR
jgi:tRNA threonylcarbamoyladenosine biosynthesis protein TsaE